MKEELQVRLRSSTLHTDMAGPGRDSAIFCSRVGPTRDSAIFCSRSLRGTWTGHRNFLFEKLLDCAIFLLDCAIFLLDCAIFLNGEFSPVTNQSKKEQKIFGFSVVGVVVVRCCLMCCMERH